MFNLPAQRYVLDTITQGLKPNKNDDLMIESEPENQLMTYISKDGDVKFDVQYDGDTVWLTQQQIAIFCHHPTKHFSTFRQYFF